MKKLVCTFIYVFFNCCNLFSQQDFSKEKNKNVLRLKATSPIFTLGVELQTQILKDITLVPKVGATVIKLQKSSTGGVTNGKIFVQYGILSSLEFRYFIDQKKRERTNKVTRNYSGWYLGIEPFILSNSVAATNTSVEKKNGSIGTFLNIGFQLQSSKKFYSGYFIGFAPWIKPLQNIERFEPYSNKRSPFWLGVSIAYCL